MAYDPNKDYNTELETLINSGAPVEQVASVLESRVEKAQNTPGLEQYAYDDVYNNALNYLAKGTSSVKNEAKSATSQPNISGTYADWTSNKIAALQSGLNSDITSLDAEAAKIPTTYQGVRNNAAITDAQNRVSLNERAAATGLNSGAGGQIDLSLKNNYGNAINKADIAEAQAKADIATQKAKRQAEYSAAVAEAKAQGDLYAVEALQAARQLEMQQEELQMQKDQAEFSKQEAIYTRQKAEKENAYNAALTKFNTMAQYGDFSGGAELGYTDEDIANMTAAYQAAQAQAAAAAAAKVSGGSGNSLTPSSIASLVSSGAIDPEQARQLLAGLGYGLVETSEETPSGVTGGSGAKQTFGDVMQGVKNEIIIYKRTGDQSYLDQADKMLESALKNKTISYDEYKTILSAVGIG